MYKKAITSDRIEFIDGATQESAIIRAELASNQLMDPFCYSHELSFLKHFGSRCPRPLQ